MSDLDEWRSEVQQMSEEERANACGHLLTFNGICYDCGEKTNA